MDWRRNERDEPNEYEPFWKQNEATSQFKNHYLSQYKNARPVFYSPNRKNAVPQRRAVHKRLGKKVVPQDDDDHLPNDISMVQTMNNASDDTNPFRTNRASATISRSFGAKATQTHRVSETITSQSVIEPEPVSTGPEPARMIDIKVEVPSLSASPQPASMLKRKRDTNEYEVSHEELSGSDIDSNSGIEKIAAKRQKIVNDVSNCGKYSTIFTFTVTLRLFFSLFSFNFPTTQSRSCEPG